MTESRTSRITSNDGDLLGLHGRLDTAEHKNVELETLSESHTTQIISKEG